VRRRLTVAVLGVVIGTLVLTVAGSVLLVRRTAVTTTEDQLRSQADGVARLLTGHKLAVDATILTDLRQAGSYDFVGVIGLDPDGTLTTLPAPLISADVDVSALEAGDTVWGAAGAEAFVAQPLSLTAAKRRTLGPVAAGDVPVLVVTRQAPKAVNGLGYFLLVAGVVLVVGAVVAAVLARRLSAPIRRAAVTTRRIAEGDLDATMAVQPRDPPELQALAEAINAMGSGLARSRGLERQFLLSVSHDLRTPLTSIRGYAEALAEGATDDVAGAVSVIGAEARRLERLVQDLLDLARLDARQFSLDIRRVDAAAVVAGAVEALRPGAAELGVELETDARPGDGPFADADTDRLGQIVANLVENGIKFAAHGVVVAVGEDDGWCRITVSDDGPGIPPADLPRVFERHFTSAVGPGRTVGTGLGLAIVSELTHSMGGSVNAQSPASAEGGTRMVLWLPSRPAPSPASSDPAGRPATERVAGPAPPPGAPPG